MIKKEVNIFFLACINFLCDFLFIQSAWWISFPPKVNQSNSNIELSSSSQPEIRQGRVVPEIRQGTDVFYLSVLI